ncbi:MAG: aldehyde dehydrogenase family protein [Fimbriimonadaceae bacterium]|nr:MAG: aldehyde dehydrogenase family protein [Fimbriimonadaceae bacterium]
MELGQARRGHRRLAQLIKRATSSLSRMVTHRVRKAHQRGPRRRSGAAWPSWPASAACPYGHVISSEIAAKDAYIVRKPKGVVGVITPWNFPFAIPLWGILPAVLAGNTVVFKPSEETPVVAHRLAELFLEAGFPKGVINVVHGFGEETGAALVGNPKVDVMVFTGSRAVGKHIQREAAAQETHKFVATELGGKNAVMVLEDANLDIAVNACLLSAFKTSGQRCVSSNRLIVDRKLIDPFTEQFLDKVKRIKVGDGLEEDTFMGPLINPDGVTKWKHHNEKAREEGGEILHEGKEITEGPLANGNFVEPFVYRFREYKEGTYCLREEAFSPHTCIIGVDGLEEAVRVYNDTDYGLAMAVITEDYRKWRWVRDHADFGLGYVNLPSIGAEVHLPFGGVKNSGNGHPAAETALDYLTHRVAFTVNHAEEIVMAQGLSTKV